MSPTERRKRTGASKILFAKISPEHFAKFLMIAGRKSYGLTIEELIDRHRAISTPQTLETKPR